jgi:hypothetical protein
VGTWQPIPYEDGVYRSAWTGPWNLDGGLTVHQWDEPHMDGRWLLIGPRRMTVGSTFFTYRISGDILTTYHVCFTDDNIPFLVKTVLYRVN